MSVITTFLLAPSAQLKLLSPVRGRILSSSELQLALKP